LVGTRATNPKRFVPLETSKHTFSPTTSMHDKCNMNVAVHAVPWIEIFIAITLEEKEAENMRRG
jgi:hypothetical protein